jgi:flagellar biosynthesis/type III secretory pathway protein FliH
MYLLIFDPMGLDAPIPTIDLRKIKRGEEKEKGKKNGKKKGEKEGDKERKRKKKTHFINSSQDLILTSY